MQAREGGLGEREGGVAREALGGEVEEGVEAEVGWEPTGCFAGDACGGYKAVCGEVEIDGGVGAGGHFEVEDHSAGMGAEVEDGGGFAGFGGGVGDEEDVGDFGGGWVASLVVKAEVVEGRAGVGVEGRVQDGTGLRAGTWGDGDGALEAEVVGVGGLGGRGSNEA